MTEGIANATWKSSVRFQFLPQDVAFSIQTGQVQIHVGCRHLTRHFLKQCWQRFMPAYDVTMPLYELIKYLHSNALMHCWCYINRNCFWKISILCTNKPYYIINYKFYCALKHESAVSKETCMMTSSNGIFSALLALCVGNSPVTGGLPTQWPVARSFDAFFDLRQLSKQFDLRRHLAHYDITVMGWNLSYRLWLQKWQGQYIYGPGVGVTEAISSVPLISRFFTIVKTLVTYWISCSYLTGVAAAQLRWHLSNINVIQII